MKDKPTFNQIAAFVLALVDLCLLAFVYYFPIEGTNSTNIISCLTGNLGIIIMFLIKASSDANHAASTSEMVDALKNSKPADQTI